ncbi:unnamed protein product [Arctia plantaginis]|uniref:Uncharacterized protein n=1 Tax=Arctia plantaginis TaxID=874455 RepID=A0A8S0ZP22_ARCPL|nr:unnamed protein product [Arctia plantaginis]
MSKREQVTVKDLYHMVGKCSIRRLLGGGDVGCRGDEAEMEEDKAYTTPKNAVKSSNFISAGPGDWALSKLRSRR